MSKFQFIINLGGLNEVISTHSTPDEAIEQMLQYAKSNVRWCFDNGYEFSAYPTSDSRYPDAWGYANNGYCIKTNGQTWQYEVTEIEDK